MKIIVGVADMRYSSVPEDVIITYSLGSCIGMTLYDTEKRIGGLVHCMLPLSKIDAAKAANNPFMFIDSGVTAFLQVLFDMGAQRKTLVAKVAGAFLGDALEEQHPDFGRGHRREHPADHLPGSGHGKDDAQGGGRGKGTMKAIAMEPERGGYGV